MNLWHPDSFNHDFGDERNDLVNCLTGIVVPNQPMKKFWEGFEQTNKRLKDDKGNPMLLKLKDWPAGVYFRKSVELNLTMCYCFFYLLFWFLYLFLFCFLFDS